MHPPDRGEIGEWGSERQPARRVLGGELGHHCGPKALAEVDKPLACDAFLLDEKSGTRRGRRATVAPRSDARGCRRSRGSRTGERRNPRRGALARAAPAANCRRRCRSLPHRAVVAARRRRDEPGAESEAVTRSERDLARAVDHIVGLWHGPLGGKVDAASLEGPGHGEQQSHEDQPDEHDLLHARSLPYVLGDGIRGRPRSRDPVGRRE